jgi:branched-chain amino acid aminotransferase
MRLLKKFSGKSNIMQKSLVHMINGKLVTEENLLIPARDLGLLRGFAVFDFFVTYGNIPFMLDDHIDRLFSSASSINLSHPWTKKHIKDMVYKTIKANPSHFDKTVKIVLSGGLARMALPRIENRIS